MIDINTTALVNTSHLSDPASVGTLNSTYGPDTAEYEKSGITESQKQKVARALKEEEYSFDDAQKMVLAALEL